CSSAVSLLPSLPWPSSPWEPTPPGVALQLPEITSALGTVPALAALPTPVTASREFVKQRYDGDSAGGHRPLYDLYKDFRAYVVVFLRVTIQHLYP
ncbi:hypothetical protein GLOTRDRAFT_137245, partial [Gloeophyllum trabeum ATCC 11539]